MQAIEARRDIVEGHILPQVPGALVHYDRERWPTKAFIQTLRMAEGEPHVHMEDDIILTRNFQSKVEAAIAQHPDQVISFFSLRHLSGDPLVCDPGDLTVPCVYLPGDVTREVVSYWEDGMARKGYEWQYCDFMTMDCLRKYRRSIVVWNPSLVQHRPGDSSISPRNKVRVSPTFEW